MAGAARHKVKISRHHVTCIIINGTTGHHYRNSYTIKTEFPVLTWLTNPVQPGRGRGREMGLRAAGRACLLAVLGRLRLGLSAALVYCVADLIGSFLSLQCHYPVLMVVGVGVVISLQGVSGCPSHSRGQGQPAPCMSPQQSSRHPVHFSSATKLSVSLASHSCKPHTLVSPQKVLAN